MLGFSHKILKKCGHVFCIGYCPPPPPPPPIPSPPKKIPKEAKQQAKNAKNMHGSLPGTEYRSGVKP